MVISLKVTAKNFVGNCEILVKICIHDKIIETAIPNFR